MSRLRGGRSLTTVPAIAISPPLIASRPAIIRSSVDFPQPEGPTNTTNSPEPIARSTPWITSLLPYDLTTLRSETSAIAQSSGERARLREPAVDDERLAGDRARFVGGEKQRGACDVILGQAELQALLLDECALLRGRRPQRALALGRDGTGRDRIDANRALAQLARQRARESVNRRLRRRISGKSGAPAHPRYRPEVDDRAAARSRHLRRDRLRREEVMAKIDGERGVPVVRRDAIERVAVVARRVVDEHADRPERRGGGGDGAAQRGDVADVAMPVAHAGAVGERARRRVVDVDEGDAAALRGERAHDRRADARRTAGNEYRAAGEIVVAGEPARIAVTHRRAPPLETAFVPARRSVPYRPAGVKRAHDRYQPCRRAHRAALSRREGVMPCSFPSTHSSTRSHPVRRPSVRGCRAARRRPPRRSAARDSTSSLSTPSTRRSIRRRWPSCCARSPARRRLRSCDRRGTTW